MYKKQDEDEARSMVHGTYPTTAPGPRAVPMACRHSFCLSGHTDIHEMHAILSACLGTLIFLRSMTLKMSSFRKYLPFIRISPNQSLQYYDASSSGSPIDGLSLFILVLPPLLPYSS
ncbi:hypothetical protein V6N13_064889 [Hibiscus sabdariffa]